jgi:hypothetical protein
LAKATLLVNVPESMPPPPSAVSLTVGLSAAVL